MLAERCSTTKRLRQLAEERKFPGVYGSDPLQNIFIKDFSGVRPVGVWRIRDAPVIFVTLVPYLGP